MYKYVQKKYIAYRGAVFDIEWYLLRQERAQHLSIKKGTYYEE